MATNYFWTRGMCHIKSCAVPNEWQPAQGQEPGRAACSQQQCAAWTPSLEAHSTTGQETGEKPEWKEEDWTSLEGSSC